MQQSVELKLDASSFVMINGRKVVQIEKYIKINEKGDKALLTLVVPAEHARSKTFKFTIDVYDSPIFKNGFNTVDAHMNDNIFESQTVGKRTKETPNLYEIAWANTSRSGRIQIWAATPVEAFKCAGFDKVSDRAYQGIRQIKI